MDAYYTDDHVTIYHGDCREILPTLAAEEVSAVITDPPYGLMAEGGKVQMRGAVGPLDYGAWDESRSFDWLAMVPASVSSLLSFHDQKDASHIVAAGDASGFKLKHFVFWDKGNSGINPRRNFVNVVEMGTWLVRGEYTWNGGGASPNIFRLPRQRTPLHPTQKPERLLLWLVRNLTAPTQLLLDPFMGSGTTLRAAKDMGCRAIGIEREEVYCETAAARMGQGVLGFGVEREEACRETEPAGIVQEVLGFG